MVYSADTYGQSGMETLQAAAEASDVCILNSYEMRSGLAAADVLSNLATSSTPVVVVIAGTQDITNLMKARSSGGKENIVKVTMVTVHYISLKIQDLKWRNWPDSCFLMV